MIRAFIAVVLLAAVGCAADPGRCCDAYSSTEERGIYCLAHKDVVTRFVLEPDDPRQRELRLQWFKSFYRTLETLGDSDAIDAKIQEIQKQHPEFWKQYSQQHFWSGRDTTLPLEMRGDLMKCGFRHGVHEMELRLTASP